MNKKWKLLSTAIFAATFLTVLLPAIPVFAPASGAVKYPLSPGPSGTGSESGHCRFNVDGTGRLHWLIQVSGAPPLTPVHFDLSHTIGETDVFKTTDSTGAVSSGDQIIFPAPPSGTIVDCHVHPGPAHAPFIIASSGSVATP